jgi:hypothetical protein
LKEVELARTEKDRELLRLTQEFKALDDQHRRKLTRYKTEYAHNIERVKDRLVEIKKENVNLRNQQEVNETERRRDQ